MTNTIGFDQQTISSEKHAECLQQIQRPRVLVSEGVNGNIYYYGNGEFRQSAYWSIEQQPMSRDQAESGHCGKKSVEQAVEVFSILQRAVETGERQFVREYVACATQMGTTYAMPDGTFSTEFRVVK